ncbi:MAG: response regulator [SAR324 cluster bacterium]|nr:response regulator [SAR324 cluster bacterium]
MNRSDIHLLAIDDEEMILLNLVIFLEEEGFSVCSASSGEEALDALSLQKIDVAVVDIRLPGIDGNELILKMHDLRPDMKFIVCTGSTEYQPPEILQNLGISETELFHKPVENMNSLVEAIVRLAQEKPNGSR